MDQETSRGIPFLLILPLHLIRSYNSLQWPRHLLSPPMHHFAPYHSLLIFIHSPPTLHTYCIHYIKFPHTHYLFKIHPPKLIFPLLYPHSNNSISIFYQPDINIPLINHLLLIQFLYSVLITFTMSKLHEIYLLSTPSPTQPLSSLFLPS